MNAEPALWTRLQHEDLGMPIPAIFIPQRLVPPDTCSTWGFESLVRRDAQKDLPFARTGREYLAADIRGKAKINLLIATLRFGEESATFASFSPRLLASGKFASPLPPEWKQAAYTARQLFVLIGPDDAAPSTNPLEQIRNLPLFNSAIAAVTLVVP